ncbi:hypothetical protein [Enterococcus termitis]|uniref:Gram-positive cocci surface proteins LPxTG domain-containing protein n=1 Tax=Enterococcus termitis TaxID=332950 RepID=A0A1E5GJ57_9ENTE|nr:hypothetical protein [Enterococcus termitis]OEG12280.1 hypothetical protein BCR25_06980 [Enterococcus termitis]OJG98905.1 hypothetical protein RV18_GL002767 [Enterococcus termitis]
MKNGQKRRIVGNVLFILIIFTLFCPVFAKAESLPSGMVIGDDKAFKVQADGKYLIEINDIMPGKQWETTINFLNVEKDTSYLVTFYSSQPDFIEGSINLAEAVQMRLVYDGKELYKGPLSGKSDTVNLQNKAQPLNLGVLVSGETKVLKVYFELDGNKYGNSEFFEKNVVENVWYFSAVKATLPSTGTDDSDEEQTFVDQIKELLRLPSTGEEWKNALLIMSLGLCCIVLFLLIIKHRYLQKKKNEIGK